MTTIPTDITHWTAHAEDWIRWARKPGHDAYWAYEHAFKRFVGPGSGKGVEIGAGEGRVSRALSSLGHQMTVVEPAAPLMAAAQAANSGVAYVSAPGHAIPLPSDEFDLVVLYNVLMDVDDLTGTMAEATRILSAGGTMIIGVVHPFADLMLSVRQTGHWDAKGAYFDARPFDEPPASRDGVTMHFRGWTRPIADYINALPANGLTLTTMEEPRPDPDHPWTQGSRYQKLPLFLWLKATNPAI